MRRGWTFRHPLYYETKGSLDEGYAEMRVIYMLLTAYIMSCAGIIIRRGAGRYLLNLDIPLCFFFHYETPAQNGPDGSSPLMTILSVRSIYGASETHYLWNFLKGILTV